MPRIFLVEDNSDHALLIKKGLEGDGCEIVHFSDGQSFLDFFKKDHFFRKDHLSKKELFFQKDQFIELPTSCPRSSL